MLAISVIHNGCFSHTVSLAHFAARSGCVTSTTQSSLSKPVCWSCSQVKVLKTFMPKLLGSTVFIDDDAFQWCLSRWNIYLGTTCSCPVLLSVFCISFCRAVDFIFWEGGMNWKPNFPDIILIYFFLLLPSFNCIHWEYVCWPTWSNGNLLTDFALVLFSSLAAILSHVHGHRLFFFALNCAD